MDHYKLNCAFFKMAALTMENYSLSLWFVHFCKLYMKQRRREDGTFGI